MLATTQAQWDYPPGLPASWALSPTRLPNGHRKVPHIGYKSNRFIFLGSMPFAFVINLIIVGTRIHRTQKCWYGMCRLGSIRLLAAQSKRSLSWSIIPAMNFECQIRWRWSLFNSELSYSMQLSLFIMTLAAASTLQDG